MSFLTLIIDKKINNAAVAPTNTSIIVSDPGNLPYAGVTDTTGIPIFDGADAGNYEACFVGIADASSAIQLNVLAGPSAGNRIIGFTYAATPGDSIEIKFYSVLPGSALSTATPYTWEAGQPTSIDLFYGFRQRQDQINDSSLRFLYSSGVLTSSASGSGITSAQHAALRQLIHLADGSGPFEQFLSGAYREILPSASPFPASVVWYENNSKAKKIIEKTLLYNQNKTPSSITWKVYDTDGITVLATVTDSMAYNGVFELNRTRVIS